MCIYHNATNSAESSHAFVILGLGLSLALILTVLGESGGRLQ